MTLKKQKHKNKTAASDGKGVNKYDDAEGRMGAGERAKDRS